jgi:ABC-type phosphate/phosphonate transport system substrate-binding protein
MSGRRKVGLLLALLALALTGGWAGEVAGAQKKSDQPPIRIGMIGSMFRDMPAAMVTACLGPFRFLMETQTGLRGKVTAGGDAFQLGEMLNSNQIHLGVFHGFEFAWARLKYPELRPLMIAVNKDNHLYAYVVASKNCDAACLADLKGKGLAIPSRTREHCLLHLERSCQGWTKETYTSVFHITTPSDIETALDDVVDGKADAALVDGVALNCYKEQKPGRFAKLKTVDKSVVFPAAVVAFHKGGVNKATLRRFRVGMINANKKPYGRQLLSLWKMTGFEPIPDDFEEILESVVKTYPPPQYKVTNKQEAH